MQDRERLLDFPRAHHESRPDVSAVLDRDLEPQAVVGVVRMIAPEVRIHAGGARRHADDPEIAGRLVGEDAVHRRDR